MKPTRNVGNLSSLHLPAIAVGLKKTTARCPFSDEETKRLKRFFASMKPLAEETKSRMQVDVAEAKVRTLGTRVGRNWIIVRDVVEAYARLQDVAPIGDEAARLLRKYFSDMAFLRFDASAQSTHGRNLLTCLAEEPMSELAALVLPVLAVQKADHVEFEAAVQESLVYLERVSALSHLRREAVEALAAFVVLAEAMATTADDIARLNTILAPVDATLAKMKVAANKPGPSAAEEPKAPEEPTKPEGPKD